MRVWTIGGVVALLLTLASPGQAAAAGDGTPCVLDTECDSSFCVDGVCCNVHCGGGIKDCQVCSAGLGGSADGTCSTLPEGASCGPPPMCTDGLLTPGQTCDGLTVNCEPALVIGCVPYACGAGACLTTCTTSSDCGIGYRCDGLSCVADVDVSFPDAGRDAGTHDAGIDAARPDASSADAARPDAGMDATLATDAALGPDAALAPSPRGCGCTASSSTAACAPMTTALGLLLLLRRRGAARSARPRARHRR